LMHDSDNQGFLTKLRRFWHPINIYNRVKSLYFAIIPKGSKAYNFTYGFLRIFLKQLHLFNIYYQEWIRRFDTLTEDAVQEVQAQINAMPEKPQISVVMPVYNPPPELLAQAIQSVLDQVYPYWELCIADDASTDPRIKAMLQSYAQKDPRIHVVFRETNGHISAASNSALELVTSDFIALLDHDDLLHPLALYYVAQTLQAHPDSIIIYSDEDKITRKGRRLDPYFKPDFDYELVLSQNMISHLGVYQTDAVRQVGGFRIGLEGSQDYDLMLRVLEHCEPTQIRHIPRPLYHWRIFRESAARDVNVKPYAIQAGTRALSEHLARRGVDARVTFLPELSAYAVNYALPDPPPAVTLILLAQAFSEPLIAAVDALLDQTDYPNYHLCLCLHSLTAQNPPDLKPGWCTKIQIVTLDPDQPFNFAQAVNQCASSAASDYICLLDSALTGFTPGWLGELVSQAAQPEIGTVAPRLINHKKRVYSNGIVLLPESPPQHLSKGEEQRVNGYFGWAKLTRGYAALSEKCLLIKTETFKVVGGFDPDLQTPLYAGVDFCLKLKTQGYRNILRPGVALYIGGDPHYNNADEIIRQQEQADLEIFENRWRDRMHNDPAFNPNLTIIDEGKILVNLSPRLDFPGK